MVNRVFCYSKDIAKQHGNKLPILPIILSTIFFLIAIFMVESVLVLMTMMIIYMGIIVYYSIILGLRMRSRMTAFVTKDDGTLYHVMTTNNGEGLAFAGLSAGKMIDQITGNQNNVGGSIGGIVGTYAQVSSMNRSAKYMSYPEIVAKMVEMAPNITGAEVFEIGNVYSIYEKRHSYKVLCDYKCIRTNKTKKRKKLTIEKSFQNMNDLLSILK